MKEAYTEKSIEEAYTDKCIEGSLHKEERSDGFGQDLGEKEQICVEHSTRNVLLLSGWPERVQEGVEKIRIYINYIRKFIKCILHREVH